MMGDTNYSKCFCIANEKVAIKMAAKEVGQGRLQEIADFLSESYILWSYSILPHRHYQYRVNNLNKNLVPHDNNM